MDHRVKVAYAANGHPERSDGPPTDTMGVHWAHDHPSFDCEVLHFAQDDPRFNLTPSTFSVLFAFVFSRRRHAIVHCVRMKHYRDQVKEKETESPASRRERRQQHEDPDWDRTKHPQKARKLVSLINMSQAGNDTKDHCDGIARFAFRSFSRAA